jgi:hypothetical protein
MPPQRSFGTPHITGTDIESLRRSVQFWLQQTYNHLDAQAGLRGTPTFHSSLDVRGNAIRAVAPATAQDEVVIKSQLDAQHSGITDALRQEIRTAIADAFNALSPGQVVAGMIFMWSGSVATIPPGFALCDGTLSTPDLRGRFVPGAGGAYAPGATGGADTLNLAHNHTNTFGTGTPSATTTVGTTGAPTTTVGSATHTHTITGTEGTALSATTDNRPAFFALCFIMKL